MDTRLMLRAAYSVAAVYPMFASDEMTSSSSAGRLNVRQVHWPVRGGGAEAVDDSCVAPLCESVRVSMYEYVNNI